MKLAGAVLVSLVILITSWLVLGGIFYFIGLGVLKAGHQPGAIMVLHVLSMWIVSPLLAGALAIYSTSRIFRSVDPDSILKGMVSISAAVLLFLLTIGTVVTIVSDRSIWTLILGIAQAVAIFVGAYFGRKFID